MLGARQVTLGAGLIGLAWWFLQRTLFKRPPRAKRVSIDKPLTVREPDELSIISYNVLSDNLVKSSANFNYANELYKSWEYRFDKLKEHISVMDADVVCLQEVEIAKWSDWKEYMDNLGYTGVLLERRSRRKSRHHAMTNATFFRSRRFHIYWEAHSSRALGVGLRWVSTDGQSHKLYVINVHLEGHPYKPAERVQQLNAIVRAMERDQVLSTEEFDIVCCGDFNSSRLNAPWHYLYTGRLEAGFTEPFYPDIEVVQESISHPYPLQDVYKSADAILEFTARAPRRRTEADFIFASRHLRVAGVLTAIDPRLFPYVDRQFLPNKHFPSDHVPVGVVLLQGHGAERSYRYQSSGVYRYGEADELGLYDAASGSIGSDSVNNIELRASVESLDSNGGISFNASTKMSTITI